MKSGVSAKSSSCDKAVATSIAMNCQRVCACERWKGREAALGFWVSGTDRAMGARVCEPHKGLGRFGGKNFSGDSGKTTLQGTTLKPRP